VVFNRDTPKSIQEIIEKLGRSQPILISDGEVASFESLTVALDGRHAHQADVHRIVPGSNIFAHRLDDFQMIRGWMRENFPSSDQNTPRKILLVRGLSKSRPIQNAAEIQRALAEIGFVAIDPEMLSIESQIITFENAEIMIAEEGAALTNLIFAKRMKLVILMGSNPHPQYSRFWREFAEVLSIESARILGTPQKHNRTGDGRYSIEVKELLSLVRSTTGT
jgi:capsular polysaccharide biosynthesis protein